ncbi:hypothetical protein L914_17966 [Phytophthora nicotianae]|uniref:Uncharacterized protein n=1 Tax=Phytophthora nicotianae TaxID=4792 RepID=W2MFC9_PHYNI|nr:hypothetical protein L914_17966 [Phytophthora nicotianae]
MADVAYVQLSGASSRATVGLYAGMSPLELQQLVRAALNHHDGVCAGFQVASTASNSRKKRQSSSIQRLVPLSVACRAPELLSGRVSALFSPSTASQGALNPQNEASEASSELKRLQRLLQALESEQKLSSFESAVLRDLCEQQSARVLAVMTGDASVGQKKRFLLNLLRPVSSSGLKNELQIPQRMDKGEETLHAELVAKKVAAIGRRVFSPQVQMQVLALSRDGWKITGSKSDSRFVDTMELLGMVERLLDKHVLPEEHGAHLLELVLGQNTLLWSALQSYKNDGGSLSDLETTAKRLAALGIDPPKPIASKKSKKSPKKLNKQSPAKKRVRNTATPSALSVMKLLHAQQMLTSLEMDIIQALVAQNDTQVLQIFCDFELGDSDASVLRDALVGIVEEITMELGDEEKAAAAFARGMDDAVREENPFIDSDDDSDSLGWQRHLSFLLGQWQAQHHLTPTAAKTLRKMVAQRHNLLESAYEVFAGDGDASELLDTLQRVAKLQRQIEQSQAGQNIQTGASTSSVSLEEVVRQMLQRGTIQAGDAAGLLVLFQGGNEALQAANEAFQADGDVHELEETLLLVVKHARFGSDAEEETVDEIQTVSRLLAELGRSGRLELWQIQLLMSLVKAHDPRLLAAVDVFHEDKNTEEFVDTLEILVELAAWERHRRAMVHDWIAPLAKKNKLPRGGAERLVQLVKARDDRVVAALVVFLSDNNKDEFVDTLTRIACLEAMKLKNVQADESKEGHLVLDLLKELEGKGVMSGEEREQVEELVCDGEARMLAAMDVLAATHDAEDFADTARRVLKKTKERTEEKKDEDKECVKAESSTDSVTLDEQKSEVSPENATEDVELSAQMSEKSAEQSVAEGEDQAKETTEGLEKPPTSDNTEEVSEKEEQVDKDEEIDKTNGEEATKKVRIEEEAKGDVDKQTEDQEEQY